MTVRKQGGGALVAGLVRVAVNAMMNGRRGGEDLNEKEKDQRQEREDALALSRPQRDM